MKRIEVILTQAIEEDFVNLYEAACKEKNIKCNYTKILLYFKMIYNEK